MDDLVSMFGREPMLTMDHFWAGGPEYHQQEYDAAIQHRVMPVDVDELWWPYAFLPSQNERNSLYKQMTGAEHRLVVDKGIKFAFDLDHNPTRRPRIACTVDGTARMAMQQRLGLLMTLIDVIDHNTVRSMVGNGWHLPSIGLLYMKLLSSIEFKTAVRPPRSMPVVVDLDAEEGTPEKNSSILVIDSPNRGQGGVSWEGSSPPSEVKLRIMMRNMAEGWSDVEPTLELHSVVAGLKQP